MKFIVRGAKRKSDPHLFLSHCSKDKVIARQLATDLILCGVDAWLDEWEIHLGQSLPDVLADAMAKSQYIGILMTENYNTSVWTKTEYRRALTREQNEGRIVMLPLLLSGVTIPDFIQDKIYVDFRTDYFAALARLIAVVHDLSTSRISRILANSTPTSIAEVWDTLEQSGFKPCVLLEGEDFMEVLGAGGRAVAPDYAHFDVMQVLEDPTVSLPVKDLLRKLA
ncbi:MAG TPA: toll/interleukin-1 receptor domain-containing protein [Pyrinomonadaceae bacterium]|nr:toll/interleukin-1 receptor domain-containing protein [Pyrinomonadaceae bacterium]